MLYDFRSLNDSFQEFIVQQFVQTELVLLIFEVLVALFMELNIYPICTAFCMQTCLLFCNYITFSHSAFGFSMFLN